MKYQAVKGMADILPKEIGIWQELERIARGHLEAWGFREIRTPILEDTAVFIRSIGETTDIVQKEMYTFIDRGDRSVTMRPEGTASIVRAFVEHNLANAFPEAGGKFYYMGPMFRAERPQKGRLRQFNQIGAEIIGTSDPVDDSEIIIQMEKMLRAFGLNDFTIKINSLGCKKDKEAYSKALQDYLKDKLNLLCDDCKARVEKNVLRVLDCKKESCSQVVSGAPRIGDSLCQECVGNFAIVKACLEASGVKFKIFDRLVRGLDYYTGTVFEITHQNLGSQDAIGAGGRYDSLVKDMGGPEIGAIGYALGIERLILALGDKAPRLKPVVVFFAALGKDARIKSIELAEELKKKYNTPYRFKLLALLGGVGGASLKSQMRSADRNSAKAVVIIGEDELNKKIAVVRDMETNEQAEVKLGEVIKAIEKILKFKEERC